MQTVEARGQVTEPGRTGQPVASTMLKGKTDDVLRYQYRIFQQPCRVNCFTASPKLTSRVMFWFLGSIKIVLIFQGFMPYNGFRDALTFSA